MWLVHWELHLKATRRVQWTGLVLDTSCHVAENWQCASHGRPSSTPWCGHEAGDFALLGCTTIIKCEALPMAPKLLDELGKQLFLDNGFCKMSFISCCCSVLDTVYASRFSYNVCAQTTGDHKMGNPFLTQLCTHCTPMSMSTNQALLSYGRLWLTLRKNASHFTSNQRFYSYSSYRQMGHWLGHFTFLKILGANGRWWEELPASSVLCFFFVMSSHCSCLALLHPQKTKPFVEQPHGMDLWLQIAVTQGSRFPQTVFLFLE